MNGTYTGVVDRIVDGQTAVILLEEDDEVVEQVDVDVEQLPTSACEEGLVLSVTVENEELVEVDPRPEETEARRQAAQDRFDRLAKPLSERDDNTK